MIVATRPLVDCVPLVPAAMEGRQLAQWDKDSCSDAGFLKIDLLGLGMLSAVERCVEHIAARRGERIDLSRIPFDDPATYDCIQNAETTGVFQIESRAQMGSLRRTRPKNLDEITIQVAIVRPGPIVGGAVNPYIERRQALNADPTLPGALPAPVARAAAARHARHDHLPGPGARGRAGVRGLQPGAGRGAAPRDEPQALGGGDRGAPSRLRRGGDAQAPGRARGARREGLRDGLGLRGLRLPEGPWGGLRPARLPVDVAARALRPGVPVLADGRAADGLLSARRARPRGPAARDHRLPARRQRERRGVLGDCRRERCGSASATSSACAPTRSPPSSRPARPAGRSRRWPISPRARVPGVPRSSASPGRAPATRSRAATGAWRCGSSASPRPACRCAAARACSSRSRSTCRRRPR